MAVDRLDVSSAAVTSPGLGPGLGSSRGTDAIGPAQGDPRIEAPFGVGGVAGAGPRRSAPDIDGIDAVEEITALAQGRGVAGPAGGLAAQLLEYVTPRPRNADALMQPRIVPLLGLAADHVGSMASSTELLDALGGRTLQQELDHHRELAERRSNRLEP